MARRDDSEPADSGIAWSGDAGAARLDSVLPWLYAVLLPALVAVAPVLLPLPLYRAWGAHASYLYTLLPGWPMVLLGAVWARQVLVAAEDDLGRRSDTAELPRDAARRMTAALRLVVWLVVLLVPLRYQSLAERRARQTFMTTSGPALSGAQAALAQHRPSWSAAHQPGKAFVPPDARFDTGAFGGPFAAPEPIGKLVFDGDGRAFYIVDRRHGVGPSLLDWARLVVSGLAGEESTLAPDPWQYERGLLHLPPGATLPAANPWGVPVVYRLELTGGWWWYNAAREVE